MSARTLLALLAALLVPLTVAVPSAFAGASMSVTVNGPSSVTIGQANVADSVELVNTSTPPEGSAGATLTVDAGSIQLVPACGAPASGGSDCPTADADPGVVAIVSGSAVGAPDSEQANNACAGVAFTTTVTDASTGQLTFTPASSIVLQSPGAAGDVCRIDFDTNVLGPPSEPASVGASSYDVDTLVAASATSSVASASTGLEQGTTALTIEKAQPSGTTTASAATPIGSSVSDTAHLVAAAGSAPAPTGTITFDLYPSSATCTGPPTFAGTVNVSAGAGDYTSPAFSPTSAGTYDWVAAYSGDPSNAGFSTGCGEPGETVTVTPASPALVTDASPAGSRNPVPAAVSDVATLSGGSSPTGTLTFDLFGPGDTTCSTPLLTSPVNVTGNGSYSSGVFTASVVGTYRWVTRYSGDANNVSTTSPCNSPNESVVISQAQPLISTVATPASPSALPVASSDTATLSGGSAPTGTITFSLFGPNNATCAGTPIFTSTATVSGNGTYPSGSFTATAPGTYAWIVTYGGDANNSPASSACGDPEETVTVNKATPAVVTVAAPAGATNPVPAAITDAATLSGGSAPTGTVTFNLFGPDDPTCSGAPVFTSSATVSGNGTYGSGSFTALTPGTYGWVVSYGGDASNTAATSACGAANEGVAITPAQPSLSTVAAPAGATSPAPAAITDEATVAGGSAPTGTITFNLFGPNNAACTGTPIFTSTATVSGNGTYDSGSFTATQPGAYGWTVSYGGDDSNAAAGSSCNAANETVTLTPAPPTITTVAAPAAATPLPASVTDTATLAGGSSPTGTITFNLFGPGNAGCTGTPTFSSTVTATGDGSYTSSVFTAVSPGGYGWVVSYSGDASNASVSSACGAPSEAVSIGQAQPTIETAASPATPQTVPAAITDSATLSGGSAPTGSLTFALFGPGAPSCTGTAVFTSPAVAVNGDGTYSSPSFAATTPGTYAWQVTYTGDADNSPVTAACGDPSESVTVTAPAAGPVPVNSSPPTITGSPVEGATLAENHGTWTGNPTAYVYQWLDCTSVGQGCQPIAGAIAQTYVPSANDVGDTIAVRETASNAAGAGAPATSAVTEPVTPTVTVAPAAPRVRPSTTGVSTATGATFVGVVSAAPTSNATTTSYYFKFGTTTAYGHQTPLTRVPPSAQGTTVEASVSGLSAHTTYHYRLFATDCAQASCIARSDDQTVTTGSALVPVLEQTVGVAPISGTITVRLLGRRRFVRLRVGEVIPLDATVNATHGVVLVVSATAARPAHQASGQFSRGIFTLTQPTAAFTVLDLDSHFAACPLVKGVASTASTKPTTLAEKRSSKRTVNEVFGNAHGAFKTSGRYATAADEGTRWLTADRCDGTLVEVVQGTIRVTDLVHHRTITLHTGQSHLS
jgi:hypothetical protein